MWFPLWQFSGSLSLNRKGRGSKENRKHHSFKRLATVSKKPLDSHGTRSHGKIRRCGNMPSIPNGYQHRTDSKHTTAGSDGVAVDRREEWACLGFADVTCHLWLTTPPPHLDLRPLTDFLFRWNEDNQRWRVECWKETQTSNSTPVLRMRKRKS